MTINPDGVSIKGCSIIYEPEGQAGEYAPLATNPYRGCGHKGGVLSRPGQSCALGAAGVDADGRAAWCASEECADPIS